ncbi:MAG: hypothetical protein CM1200mP35_00670 [Chloroflexota bacterium]|nr:MAG: hypothetical protein CM1200mP35_00670 [Chloroflexota bacterium]
MVAAVKDGVCRATLDFMLGGGLSKLSMINLFLSKSWEGVKPRFRELCCQALLSKGGPWRLFLINPKMIVNKTT